jgi:hypothetical protein
MIQTVKCMNASFLTFGVLARVWLLKGGWLYNSGVGERGTVVKQQNKQQLNKYLDFCMYYNRPGNCYTTIMQFWKCYRFHAIMHFLFDIYTGIIK